MDLLLFTSQQNEENRRSSRQGSAVLLWLVVGNAVGTALTGQFVDF